MSRLRRSFKTWFSFFFRIVFPTFLAILLSAASIYFAIIPEFKSTIYVGKREMIQQLTNVAWSILELYQQEEAKGNLSKEEAQEKALITLSSLRYGEENQDYFWITDNVPTMLMHPYSPELIGVDLSDFEDIEGKRIFQEIQKTVSNIDGGFIDYNWNKKYSQERVTPKLSYVRQFEPWQWVVGTGMFLDDVERKTAVITHHLSKLSFAAVAVIALLLFYVGRQGYVIEVKRKKAEWDLSYSRRKYKKLVETATDPILMIFAGRCIYSNKPLCSLLSFTKEEFEYMELRHLFVEPGEDIISVIDSDTAANNTNFDVTVISKTEEQIPVHLAVTKIDMDGKDALVLNFKDKRKEEKIIHEQDDSLEKYRILTDEFKIGVFRTKAERRLRLIGANQSFLDFMEIEDEGPGVSIQEILKRNNVTTRVYNLALEEGGIRDKSLLLKSENREIIISLSLVVTNDEQGSPLYFDGIVEDISERKKWETAREELIIEMQTSQLFLNQPLSHFHGDYEACEYDITVHQAVELMGKTNSSSILVQDSTGEVCGIVTDDTILDKVVAKKLPYHTPVGEIASFPPVYIDKNALIFEASMVMEEKGVKHLVVKDSKGEIQNIISNEDILNFHRNSSSFLMQEIREAKVVSDVFECHERLPRIIKALVDSGAHAKNITKIITTVSDTILARLIHFAIEELGQPPTRFAFISLGSEGRMEQTLATDQDNAIIFEDVSEERRDDVFAYFNRFSEKICTWLDRAGYDFCLGNVMAMNPQWCQPISQWKKYFSSWITEAKPKDLMEVSIFFDFRCMYGDPVFTEELRKYIAEKVANRDAFFYQLAQNALLFRLPVDFFGKISVETKGEYPNTFNIKHAVALIVGYARIYAITFSLEETNTLKRLSLLSDSGFIGKQSHREISDAYNYLMQIRFKHQVAMINQGQKAENHISLDELSYMEKSTLEKIFSQIGSLQKQLLSIGKVEIFF